jgi:hypothetical protein
VSACPRLGVPADVWALLSAGTYGTNGTYVSAQSNLISPIGLMRFHRPRSVYRAMIHLDV